MKMNRKSKTTKLLAGALSAILLIGMSTFLSGCYVANWSFGDGRMEGNGRMTDGEFTVDHPLTEINLDNISATVNLTDQASDRVTYTIDENLTRFLEIEERNGRLTVSSTNGKGLGRQRRITFNIGTDALEKLEIRGDVKINSQGICQADRFSVDVAGAATAALAVESERLDIEIAGAAGLTLTGKTGKLNIACDGASTITANGLIADAVTVDTNGASTVAVHAEETLDISGAGIGTVKYWGNPEITRATAGFSSVSRGDEN